MGKVYKDESIEEIMNIEKISKSLEELIRRKDSGVFFGVFGIGNILGKEISAFY